MNLYCPNCQGTFSGSSTCPRCGIRLISPSEAFSIAFDRPPVPPPPATTPFLGRVIVGVIIAAGTYLGIQDWSLGILQLLGRLDDRWWLSSDALILAVSLRSVAIAIGSSLAGAGRPRGAAAGIAVAVLATIGFLYSDVVRQIPIGLPAIGSALIFLLVGGISGAIGAGIWPGPTEQPVAKQRTSSRGSSLLQLVEESTAEAAAKPTQWLRILFTSVLAIVAVAQAESVRLGLRAAAGQSLNLGNAATYIYVDLQIAVLLMATALVMSGASTGAGLRHGLFAGLLTAFGVILISQRGLLPPAVEGWLQLLHLPNSLANGKSLAAVAGGILLFGTACGWLGNALLPPLARGEQRSRRLLD